MERGVFRYFIAVLLISIGAVLVLENLGLVQFKLKFGWTFLFPLLFIIMGLKWIIDRLRHRGGSWTFGSFFLIFGTLLMLDRFEVMTFSFKDVFKLWPLLIIYFGFLFIGRNRITVYKPSTHRVDEKDFIFESPHDEGNSTGKKQTVYHDKGTFFSVGNYEYNQPNWKVEPMTLRSMAGDFYFDFSKAYIPEKKIPISIHSLAGDVHILIPENIEFRVEASVKAGDIDVVGQSVDGINRSLLFETPHFTSAERKLDFFINLKAGSIRVDYV